MPKILSFRDLLVWQKSMKQTQVELGKRIEIVTEQDAVGIIADAAEIGRMLHGLVASLERGR